MMETGTHLSAIVDQLTSLKQQQFTGCLEVRGYRGATWYLYIFLGRLLYATSNKHKVRRWWRHLSRIAPHLQPAAIRSITSQQKLQFWEYDVLLCLTEVQLLTPEQANRIIQGILTEIFFEICRPQQLEYTVSNDSPIHGQLMLVDAVRLIEQQQQLWQRLQEFGAVSYNYDFAPIIEQPERLKEQTPETVYQNLFMLLDRQSSIWDIALKMGRSPVEVLAWLKPFIDNDVITLNELADLEAPVAAIAPQKGNPNPTPPSVASPNVASPNQEAPLIVCIDDSAWVCQTLEKVIVESGYRFIGIQDPLRAIPTLLAKKPGLILLDVRMPNTNGYELCSQLRKLSTFQSVPILILTGNDGIVDRVRATMVGANDFLSKTIDRNTLVSTLRKYLPVFA